MQRYNPKISDIARGKMAEFVRQRRKEMGITQEDLSAMAGIRKATLVDLEKGKNFTVNTFLAVLGCLRGELQIIWKEPDDMPGFGKPNKN